MFELIPPFVEYLTFDILSLLSLKIFVFAFYKVQVPNLFNYGNFTNMKGFATYLSHILDSFKVTVQKCL